MNKVIMTMKSNTTYLTLCQGGIMPHIMGLMTRWDNSVVLE